MKEFGAKLILKDKMSETLKRNVKQQREFTRQVQQTRQAVQDLGKTSATPTVEVSNNVTQTIRKVKDAIDSVGKEKIMTRVEVQDEATKKANMIADKLKELRSKVTSPIISLKDQITDKVSRIKAKLRDIAVHFTPIVKIRDLASQGLSKIKNTLGGLAGKVTQPLIKVKDLATAGINKVRVALATAKKLVAMPVVKIRDLATNGITKVKTTLGALAKKVTSPIVKLRDTASPIITKVKDKLGAVGRTIASPVVKLVDKAAPVLKKVGSSLKTIGKTVATATVAVKDKASAVLSKIGGALAKVGKMGAVALGGAAVASVKLAADFESGMSNVAAISGETGGALDKLSAKAKEMGAKTKFSAKEATEAYQYMAMAGWKSGDMLEGIEPLMKLAGASGEDLATTSDIVTDGLTAFGMSAKDTGRFADVLAAASANANTNVSMMGESFKYAAPVAGALGFSVEDTSLALGLMANSGIKASNAGTALRSMLTNMAKPTKQSSQALDALGISLTDSTGQMKPFKEVMGDLRKGFAGLTEDQKASYAASIAGKTGMSGLLAVVNASDKDFDKLASAIEGSNGACEKMYETANDNLAGQLTILKSTVESIGIAFGEKLTPAVKKAVGVVQGIGEKINNMLDPTTKAGKKFDEMGSKILGTVKHILESGAKLLEPFKSFGDGMLPVAEIVSMVCDGITARIDAMMPILLPLAEGIAGAFGEIGGAIEAANAQISPMVAGIGADIGGMITEIIPVITQIVSMLIGQLPNVVGVIQSITQAVRPVISSILPVISSMVPVISNILSIFFNLVQTFLPIIGNLVSTVITAITPILDTIFQLIQTALPIVTEIITVVASVVQSLVPVIGAIIQAVVPPIQQVLQALMPVIKLLGKVVQTVAPVIGALVKAVGSIIMAVVPAVGKIFQSVANIITGAVNVIRSVIQALSNFLSPVCSVISGLLQKLGSIFSSVFGGIASAVSSAVGTVSSVISGVTGVISGFVDKIGGALSKVKDFATKSKASGFAYGKERVPYDNYPAILHQGERVLTRNEADQYDRLTSTRGVHLNPLNNSIAVAGTTTGGSSGDVIPVTGSGGNTTNNITVSPNINVTMSGNTENTRELAERISDDVVDILVKELEKVSKNKE